jgi:hypothetical protein
MRNDQSSQGFIPEFNVVIRVVPLIRKTFDFQTEITHLQSELIVHLHVIVLSIFQEIGEKDQSRDNEDVNYYNDPPEVLFSYQRV